MTINTTLQNLSPPLLDRLSREEIKAIAITTAYTVVTIRRMLSGKGEKYGYNERNVTRVLAKALEIMRSTEKVDKLEVLFRAYIVAA